MYNKISFRELKQIRFGDANGGRNANANTYGILLPHLINWKGFDLAFLNKRYRTIFCNKHQGKEPSSSGYRSLKMFVKYPNDFFITLLRLFTILGKDIPHKA